MLIGAVLVLYARVLGKLAYDWYSIPDFSHGFLLPVFSGYLLWQKRERLSQLIPKPANSAVVLILLSLSLLVAGVFGAELFLTRISLLLLLTSLLAFFYGWKYVRECSFALGVLLLAVPIPAIIFNQITFPLQILASQLASNILPLLGVPVLRDGNVIQLPAMPLEVAEACSGIRSLMSLGTLAVLYGYFLEKLVWRRVVIALLSVPIAVAANALRIVGTGLCVQYWDPDKALGFFHEFSGWVVFVLSLLILYGIHRVMHVFLDRKPVAA
ncbi:MAG TPA: exosortase/archaeosortase family protein [Terriglobales bacterium]